MSGMQEQRRLARGMLARGLVLLGLLAAAHLMGWREHTSVLCGMAPTAGSSAWLAGYAGAAYVVCYVLATMAAPVLLIASAVLWILTKWQIWKGAKDECNSRIGE